MRSEYGAASELVAASLVALAARSRLESRGGHFRQDYPDAAPPIHSDLSQGRPFNDGVRSGGGWMTCRRCFFQTS